MLFKKERSIEDLKDMSYKDLFGGMNMRHNAIILVIDDDPFLYLEALQNQDFNIRQITDIADIKIVIAYDIILCDIKGVGKAFASPYEGAHVIKEIKKYYPSKFVIAYSAHSFDTLFNDFFRIADAVIKKDIDSSSWVEKLDLAIETVTNPVYQWKKIREYLLNKDVPLKTVLVLEDAYVKRLLGEKTVFENNKVLNELSADIKSVIINLISSGIFSLLIGGK